ncbi:major facilitator superfamily domain-containing protein [Emericellopsis atlantica]|uniref:Major facilitator superfamily domain-containing protein n=1 Tax=Emericellopsis atlantica TaxID=2614577 RepID=A0A9P7ZFM9_9HYPO|nr:major facilitator superfamily domain-containing protein [Emericellopsis atlantica]KAG9251269.1 major facilitator superfamily domain-containing protein [Emericellopsis atlantica]
MGRQRDEGQDSHIDDFGEPSRRIDDQRQPLSTASYSSPPVSPDDPEEQRDDPKRPIAWRELPRKDQLIIITLARLSEPLVQTSLQAYLFYQLRSFDPSLPSSKISSQAGIMHASFMFAQFLTGMLWGRVADSRYAGRKVVLLVGLTGTGLSCLGFGFATSFWQALVFRTMGGATNGNIGVMRTMISEIIREKKYQSRAFLLLPMTFNIGVIVGPILGGVLSDPAGSYPSLFKGIPFFEKYPYATPNIVSSVFLMCAAAAVWLGLEETLDSIRDTGHVDLGIRVRKSMVALFRRRRHGYSSIPTSSTHDDNDASLDLPEAGAKPQPQKRFTQRLPFKRVFTPNVVLTFVAHFLMAFHVGTFNSLWFVFLSTPVYDPGESDITPQLPFRFTGGLGLKPQSVGLAMAILGTIGIFMQLVLYPRINARLGTIRSWRYFLYTFPVAYFLVPYLSIVPSSSPPPHAKTGLAMWMAFVGILMIQVLGRTFALPAQAILINNCSPHPSVLGTVHGMGQSVSSGARTIGPMVGGFVYGLGLNAGYVGLVWWCLSVIAVLGVVASWFVREGDGHEIWLEGDAED